MFLGMCLDDLRMMLDDLEMIPKPFSMIPGQCLKTIFRPKRGSTHSVYQNGGHTSVFFVLWSTRPN